MLASSAAFEAASTRLATLEVDLADHAAEHTSLHIGRSRDMIIQARKQQRAAESAMLATKVKLERVRRRQATALALLERGMVLEWQVFSVHGKVIAVVHHTPWQAHVTIMHTGRVEVRNASTRHVTATVMVAKPPTSDVAAIVCAKFVAVAAAAAAAAVHESSLLLLVCYTGGDVQLNRLSLQQHDGDGDGDGDCSLACECIAQKVTAPWLLSAYGVPSAQPGVITDVAYVTSQRYFVCIVDAPSSLSPPPPPSPSDGNNDDTVAAASNGGTPRQTLLVALDVQNLRILWSVRPLSIVINAPPPPATPASTTTLEAEREHRALSLNVMQSGTVVVLVGTNWGVLLRFDVTVFTTARDVTYEVSSHTWHHFTRHDWPTRTRTAITCVAVNRSTTVAVACSDATIRVLSLFRAPTSKVKTHSTANVVTTNIQTLSPLPPSLSAAAATSRGGRSGGDNGDDGGDDDDDDEVERSSMTLMMAKAAGPYAPVHIAMSGGGGKVYAFHPNGRLLCWAAAAEDGAYTLHSVTHTMSFNTVHHVSTIGDDERHIVMLDRTQWAIWRDG